MSFPKPPQGDTSLVAAGQTNPLDYTRVMLSTITELPEYIRRADELLSPDERKAIIDYLAQWHWGQTRLKISTVTS